MITFYFELRILNFIIIRMAYHKVQSSKLKAQSSKLKVQSSKFKAQSSKLKVQCYRLSRKALVTLNDPSAILAQKSKYCCALVSFSGTSLMMRKDMNGVL